MVRVKDGVRYSGSSVAMRAQSRSRTCARAGARGCAKVRVGLGGVRVRITVRVTVRSRARARVRARVRVRVRKDLRWCDRLTLRPLEPRVVGLLGCGEAGDLAWAVPGTVHHTWLVSVGVRVRVRVRYPAQSIIPGGPRLSALPLARLKSSADLADSDMRWLGLGVG